MSLVAGWGVTGETLVTEADERNLIRIAATAAKIQTLATVRLLSGRSTPILMDAKAAAAFLGPSFSAKWLYNHWRDLPPKCVHRIGSRVLFRGEPLRQWASDSRETVTRRR
jgi:hypothetical protein